MFKVSLEEAGYSVDTFTDPLKAFDIFRSNSGDYDLVISDVRHRRHKIFSFGQGNKTGIRILVMSFFDRSEIEPFVPSLNILGFLQKPMTPRQFSKHIASYINEEVEMSEQRKQ